MYMQLNWHLYQVKHIPLYFSHFQQEVWIPSYTLHYTYLNGAQIWVNYAVWPEMLLWKYLYWIV